MDRFLPYSRQIIDDDDIQAVTRVLSDDLITQGTRVSQFEEALAKVVGSEYAVVCANGTAALHLACLALGIGKEDNLVTPTVTFLASANCGQFVGANTTLVDIDSDSWCISTTHLESILKEKKVDVVVPVHFAGQCADMKSIKTMQEKYGFRVIEDACHALGATQGTSKVGSCEFSDLTVFSFHPVKHITLGEGGAITTNNEQLYRRLLRFRTHGIHKEASLFVNHDLAYDDEGKQNLWYYEMSELGLNYRITDIQCALGLSQLSKLSSFVESRRHIASTYNSKLKSIPLITTPHESVSTKHAYHLYTLLIDYKSLGRSRNSLMYSLRSHGIGTQVLYIPVHLQPYYARKYGYKFGDFPNAENYYERCLSIPIFPSMSSGEVDYVVRKLESLIK